MPSISHVRIMLAILVSYLEKLSLEQSVAQSTLYLVWFRAPSFTRELHALLLSMTLSAELARFGVFTMRWQMIVTDNAKGSFSTQFARVKILEDTSGRRTIKRWRSKC